MKWEQEGPSFCAEPCDGVYLQVEVESEGEDKRWWRWNLYSRTHGDDPVDTGLVSLSSSVEIACNAAEIAYNRHALEEIRKRIVDVFAIPARLLKREDES